MYKSTIFAAAIACASAVTIKSEAEAEWGWIDDIGDAFEDFGNGFVDTFEDIGNGIADGFGGMGDWFAGDFTDFWVDDVGGAFDDAWGWVSDGGNWEAFGTTLAGGTVALLSGDPDAAIAMWGNSDHYTADYWDEMEEKKRQAAADEARAREYYAQFVAKKQEFISTTLPEQREFKEQYCAAMPNRQRIPATIGTEYKDRRSRNTGNSTKHFGWAFGSDAAGFYEDMFAGAISQAACEAADCLHPCYGASHEASCNMCLSYARSKIGRGGDFLPLSAAEDAACSACKIPPQEFDTSIPSFEQWMAEVRASQ